MFPKKPVIIQVDPRDELNELILEASSILKDVRKYVSPRHGFEPMIDQAQLIYEDAQGFYSSQRFKEAKNSFQETIEACKEIMALDEMRDLAVNIQESLQSVHEVHEQELYIEAVLAFDNRNFNEAIRLFIALEQKLESKAQVADFHSQQQDLNKFKQYKLKIEENLEKYPEKLHVINQFDNYALFEKEWKYCTAQEDGRNYTDALVHARIALNLIQNLNENAQHLYFEYNSWYEAIQKNVKKRYENLSSKQLKEIRNLLRKAKVLKDDLELKKAVQVLKDFNDLGYLKEVSVKLTRKDNGNSGSVVTVTDHLHDGANRMIERQELLSGEYPIEIKLKKTGMVFRLVPAGNFVMGQKDGRYDELPFDVVISEPFYIGKYEITQQIWAQVMGNNPSFFLDNGAKAPVEQVSWEDIQRFIRKLSKLEGIDSDALHLPTEAQWEYAARGGTQEGHYAKNPEDTAWFVVNANRQTQTVGAKSPNALGLYDMTGNVAELCMDWYDTYPTEKTTDYRGPSNGKFKVYRGGGWFDDESSIRSGKRSRMEPNKKSKEVGFRLIANLKIVK